MSDPSADAANVPVRQMRHDIEQCQPQIEPVAAFTKKKAELEAKLDGMARPPRAARLGSLGGICLALATGHSFTLYQGPKKSRPIRSRPAPTWQHARAPGLPRIGGLHPRHAWSAAAR